MSLATASAVTDSPFVGEMVPFRGGHLSVVSTGEGEPVVGYLHGMLGNFGCHPALEALAAATGRRVVAPSLPGFTGSSEPDGLVTTADWVVALSEAVDLVGLTGADVVASSVGAMLALELAAVRPEAFGRMVLVAPFGLWDDADPIADAFGTTLSVQRSMLTASPDASAAFFEDPPDLPADASVEHGVHRYLTRAAAAQLIWPLPEFGLSERLHLVKNPVTLIHGANEQIIPPSYLRRWEQALTHVAGTHLIDGAGHQAEFDAPDQVAAIAATAFTS